MLVLDGEGRGRERVACSVYLGYSVQGIGKECNLHRVSLAQQGTYWCL